jgi:hypothetical protein
MNTVFDPVLTAPVRIRFAGTENAETFHMIPREAARFHADWVAYLGGNGMVGGAYATEEADHPLVISLSFKHIAYTEPGKIY